MVRLDQLLTASAPLQENISQQENSDEYGLAIIWHYGTTLSGPQTGISRHPQLGQLMQGFEPKPECVCPNCRVVVQEIRKWVQDYISASCCSGKVPSPVLHFNIQ